MAKEPRKLNQFQKRRVMDRMMKTQNSVTSKQDDSNLENRIARQKATERIKKMSDVLQKDRNIQESRRDSKNAPENLQKELPPGYSYSSPQNNKGDHYTSILQVKEKKHGKGKTDTDMVIGGGRTGKDNYSSSSRKHHTRVKNILKGIDREVNRIQSSEDSAPKGENSPQRNKEAEDRMAKAYTRNVKKSGEKVLNRVRGRRSERGKGAKSERRLYNASYPKQKKEEPKTEKKRDSYKPFDKKKVQQAIRKAGQSGTTKDINRFEKIKSKTGVKMPGQGPKNTYYTKEEMELRMEMYIRSLGRSMSMKVTPNDKKKKEEKPKTSVERQSKLDRMATRGTPNEQKIARKKQKGPSLFDFK